LPARDLRAGLHLLLVRTHFFERLAIGDVGYRSVGLCVAELASRLAPAFGAYAELLAEQGEKNLRLLLPEPGQRLDSSQQILPVVDTAPDVCRIVVVVVGDDST